MSIEAIPSKQHYHADAGWLSAYWHFSFDHYYDEKNMHWGALRVFNNDTIAPASGFPFHPHANMEIVTYVISGELTHEDSLGNKGKIGPGEVQRMSAGKGVVHSEYNHSKTTPCELVQMWVLPQKKDIEPSWEQQSFTKKERMNRLLCVVAQAPQKRGLRIGQDASFRVSFLENGKALSYATQTDRKLYVFVISGSLSVNGKRMEAKDSAKIKNEEMLEFLAEKDCDWMLWDCPAA
ncbi:MAG: pirin family protein [Candidatus Iainarchaeum archaeon]|uniref:Pirin family protein n=1 Tax=Candidatus Iainarchaeum sp. TaxID=3101447 RepID=A0A7T9DKL8_9ARCH|nr:MAG: pirin family protein [Candidatus Diapherotrites archaeon]